MTSGFPQDPVGYSTVKRENRSPYDWSDVDWSQSDPQIAHDKGCHINTVFRARRKLGKPAFSQRKVAKEVWDTIDWSKSDRRIAHELRLHPTTIQSKRKQLAKQTNPNVAPSRDWKAVDWSKSDRRLAAELGCHVTTVQLWRRKVGRPSDATCKKDQARAQQWDAWPEGAHKEIRLTIDYMDLHGGFIPARKMVDRLREHWQVETDEDALEAYSRTVLNRRNWSTK